MVRWSPFSFLTLGPTHCFITVEKSKRTFALIFFLNQTVHNLLLYVGLINLNVTFVAFLFFIGCSSLLDSNSYLYIYSILFYLHHCSLLSPLFIFSLPLYSSSPSFLLSDPNEKKMLRSCSLHLQRPLTISLYCFGCVSTYSGYISLFKYGYVLCLYIFYKL